MDEFDVRGRGWERKRWEDRGMEGRRGWDKSSSYVWNNNIYITFFAVGRKYLISVFKKVFLEWYMNHKCIFQCFLSDVYNKPKSLLAIRLFRPPAATLHYGPDKRLSWIHLHIETVFIYACFIFTNISYAILWLLLLLLWGMYRAGRFRSCYL